MKTYFGFSKTPTIRAKFLPFIAEKILEVAVVVEAVDADLFAVEVAMAAVEVDPKVIFRHKSQWKEKSFILDNHILTTTSTHSLVHKELN